MEHPANSTFNFTFDIKLQVVEIDCEPEKAESCHYCYFLGRETYRINEDGLIVKDGRDHDDMCHNRHHNITGSCNKPHRLDRKFVKFIQV